MNSVPQHDASVTQVGDQSYAAGEVPAEGFGPATGTLPVSVTPASTDALHEPPRFSTKAKVTLARGLPWSATAAKIYTVIGKSEEGTALHYLCRALEGERIRGEKSSREQVPSFSAISGDVDVEDALDEALCTNPFLSPWTTRSSAGPTVSLIASVWMRTSGCGRCALSSSRLRSTPARYTGSRDPRSWMIERPLQNTMRSGRRGR